MLISLQKNSNVDIKISFGKTFEDIETFAKLSMFCKTLKAKIEASLFGSELAANAERKRVFQTPIETRE